MKRSEWYQIALVGTGLLTAVLIGLFVYREIFPEYKIFQEGYKDIEAFRSTYTGEAPPEFKTGIKQIVIPRQDNGPEVVDRCVSCHVAVQLPHFSPTKIALDINGQMVVDELGKPVLVPNEDYVWRKLDDQIARLEAEKGDTSKEVAHLRSLRYKELDGKWIDMSKVLSMHPLMGLETRPFENHSLDDYGCTVCHSGNGRSVVMSRAHGPVFDEEYESSYSYKPSFAETDDSNDPKFARVFNAKPGDALLFQTTPILVGHLIQSRCVQCHTSTDAQLNKVTDSMGYLAKRKEKQIRAIEEGYNHDKEALISLLENYLAIKTDGYEKTLAALDGALINPNFTPAELDRLEGRRSYLQRFVSGSKQFDEEQFLVQVRKDMASILGSAVLADKLQATAKTNGTSVAQRVDAFIQDAAIVEMSDKMLYPESNIADRLQNGLAQGVIEAVQAYPENLESRTSIFSKRLQKLQLQAAVAQLKSAQDAFSFIADEHDIVSDMASPVDAMLYDYKRGMSLYINNACYACHRIVGFSRGNVGPELTSIGFSYPWYVKASIVWPQGKLASSQMPAFGMDSEDVEDLMTFMMAQRGEDKTESSFKRQASTRAWELGQKMPWEMPLPPSQMKNITVAMKIFAEQGCAACHRLEGFTSDVGFLVEKNAANSSSLEHQTQLLKEYEWFRALVPEQISGMQLAAVVEANKEEIDQHIVDGVRERSILEEIERENPLLLESYYANFKFAGRAKNDAAWKERMNRVLMMYIQTYGLGRLIGPRLNWSGVYRDNEWMMGHFHNPGAFTARSIMPTFPFDDTKFYTLTVMLHQLGNKNRDIARTRWQIEGFNPAEAYQLYCSACHGENLHGDGPVAKWIYPVPKNLRNSIFLENLTRERATYSILHGVQGTPMPPWGEALEGHQPVLSRSEAEQLTDWIFRTLPSDLASITEEKAGKWNYTAEDVVKSIKNEKSYLHGFLANAEILGKDAGSKLSVEDLFDVVPNPKDVPGDVLDKNLYYIKHSYYTLANINEGRDLFTLNCAHCHGSDAGGMGPRAAVMVDAKPRMLANLPWLKSRDDLRLIRSIKFGVAGTSMTPWGDQMTTLQQMQLVIYIRSLAKEKIQNDALTSLIYKVFEESQLAVSDARVNEYKAIQGIQEQYQSVARAENDLVERVKQLQVTSEDAGETYAQELALLNRLARWKHLDETLQKLKEANQQEGAIYETLGASLIIKDLDESLVDAYLNMLKIRQPMLRIENETLRCGYSENKEKEIAALQDIVIAKIDKLHKQEEAALELALGKLPSAFREEEVAQIKLRKNAFVQLRTRFITQMELAASLRKSQCSLFEDATNQSKALRSNGETSKKVKNS